MFWKSFYWRFINKWPVSVPGHLLQWWEICSWWFLLLQSEVSCVSHQQTLPEYPKSVQFLKIFYNTKYEQPLEKTSPFNFLQYLIEFKDHQIYMFVTCYRLTERKIQPFCVLCFHYQISIKERKIQPYKINKFYARKWFVFNG